MNEALVWLVYIALSVHPHTTEYQYSTEYKSSRIEEDEIHYDNLKQ